MHKLEGKIKAIFPTNTHPTFQKRIFWLDDCAEKFRNVYYLELWKKDCEMIDNYQVGDKVTAYVDIKGLIWEENGKEVVRNALKCWNIEKDGKTFKEI